ncbi:uncharacterized protein LOC126236785 isoform X1 [Schistocerca nitens]|uniref:uncharacterized protein LOC126236785 isoform X1 n=2 Tax=Schistocerca nitens TaxID=7011 RepID=UPI002119AE72|nr:uncharacterized protein LOC126236785 isoform X1 [Schistocerca nitens]
MSALRRRRDPETQRLLPPPPSAAAGWLSARDVLWYLTFCGFAINYMLRININIAIVGMARSRARQQTGGPSAASYCESDGVSALGVPTANYTDSFVTGDISSHGPRLFTTPSVNRTELYVPNNTSTSGIDIETKYTVQFNISTPIIPKNVDANMSSFISAVDVTHSVTGTNFTILNSTEVPSPSAIPFKTSEDYNTLDSIYRVSSRTVSTRAPVTNDIVNDTGTVAADFSDLPKEHSMGNDTTPSPPKTSSCHDSPGVLDSDGVDKTTVPKTLPSLPQKQGSSTGPTTVPATAHQMARADNTQAPQSMVTGGASPPPPKTSTWHESPGNLGRDSVDKTSMPKTITILPPKQVSSTVPTTVSTTGIQMTKADNMQAPHLMGTGLSSTTSVPMLPAAMALSAEEDGRYDWDEYQQGLVLGGFFWLHWCTQIPGGMLAQRIGPKLVFGVSNLVACLLAVLLPLAASIDYRALIAVRVLQGFIAGAAWPSMHSMTANWIPPNDRSKFVTAYLGSSVGAALTFPLCGFLMEWFGWPTVFYSTALLGSAWFLAWWFLVFDHPHVHPRISRTELDYLKSNLGQSVAKRKPPTPWGKILTSMPLWMNVLAQWGGIWGLFTMLTQAPTYFRHVHGWSIRATGLLSGFPHICRITFAMMVSWVGDYMLKKEIVSRTNLRKIATVLCTVVQGVLVLGLAYSGCSPVVAAVCLAAAVGASGAVSTGPLASLVDISPNYASILMGITNMLTVLPGFISPIIVGLLTYQNQTPDAWRIVFLITAAMLVVPGIVYTFCASSELQPWNTPTSADPHQMEAMPEKVPLKSDVDEDGSPTTKLYFQDDGNLLTKQDFQKDGNLLTKQDLHEDGSVPTETDISTLSKSDVQEDGSVLTKPDGNQTNQDANKSRDTITKPQKETIASFPIVPDVGRDEGVPNKPDVKKDEDVPNKTDVEEVDVPAKPNVEEDTIMSIDQEPEIEGSEPTTADIKEDGSVPTKSDIKGNGSDTQRKTDIEMGDARNPDENVKADQHSANAAAQSDS